MIIVAWILLFSGRKACHICKVCRKFIPVDRLSLFRGQPICVDSYESVLTVMLCMCIMRQEPINEC